MDLALLFNGRSGEGQEMYYGNQYWALTNALHRHACDLGEGDGCAELAEQVRWDRALDPLGEKGLNALGCAKGSAHACYQAVANWGKHSDAPDLSKEIAFAEKACKLSGRLGCHLVAGVMRNDAVASYDQDVMHCLNGEAHKCYLAGYFGVIRASPPPAPVRRALYDYGCRFGYRDACQALAPMR
ncbi:hypothetical protein [uncultured Pelagimonas sp.]|uniref:hypothetical protein n=1 Tax=uncultured Pelagimonas sp. TaxID=1618102 RepID=UPI00262C8806|nr:hypothetical protein [uncultured Pelagimonas sp.]